MYEMLGENEKMRIIIDIDEDWLDQYSLGLSKNQKEIADNYELTELRLQLNYPSGDMWWETIDLRSDIKEYFNIMVFY